MQTNFIRVLVPLALRCVLTSSTQVSIRRLCAPTLARPNNLTMCNDSLDAELDQRIYQAQQHPDNSEERKHLIREILRDIPLRRQLFERVCRLSQAHEKQQSTQTLRDLRKVKQLLVWIMQQSGNIWRSGEVSEVYQEALSRTWVSFHEKLDQYDPERASPVVWFNDTLKYKIKDVEREIAKAESKRARPLTDVENEELDLTGNIADSHPEPDPNVEASNLLEQIHQWLEQEKKSLQQKRMANRPDVDCYFLILSRLPVASNQLGQFEDGKTWDELARNLQDSDLPSLTPKQIQRYYNEKCLPYLQKFLQSQGYRAPRKPKLVPELSSSQSRQ